MDDDTRIRAVLACLDDARTALREANKHAAPVISELASWDPRTLVLRRVARRTEWITDINKDIQQLEMLNRLGDGA